jgi:hypothetical protein
VPGVLQTLYGAFAGIEHQSIRLRSTIDLRRTQMSRKRILLFAAPAVAAFAAAGVALAAGGGPQASTTSATFSATTVSNARLTTCTVGGGDTFATTIATYTGTATSSDARLDGTFKIRATSLVDTNNGLGRVVGFFKINNADGLSARGSINAAIANGDAEGSTVATLRTPYGRLFATLSSPFDPAVGFGSGSSGSIGTGTSAGSGVVVSGLACTRWHRHPLRWLHRHMRKHHK